jgi:hypothetical protein
MDSGARERLVIENDLRHAVERRQLVLHYQPRVECRSGRLLGVEALVRWQHPSRGLVSAGNFIPVVEEITPEIELLAGGAGSALGTGGMLTKVTAAKRATEAGVDMIITNGAHAEVLYDIVEGKPVGTRFVGRKA